MNIDIYKSTFEKFCSSFLKNDESGAYLLKYNHSFEVLKNAEIIANSIGVNTNTQKLVQVAALFHDLGRFPQYKKYHTFNDAISEDHGQLSAKTMIEQKILAALPTAEQATIITAIKLHNKFSIENVELDGVTENVTKILRDADKLDIFRIMTEKTEPINFLNKSQQPLYSENIKHAILDNKLAKYEDVITTCDFQLLQLTWINDINFQATLDYISKNQYIDKLIDQLPNKTSIKKEIEHITLKLTNYAIH